MAKKGLLEGKGVSLDDLNENSKTAEEIQPEANPEPQDQVVKPEPTPEANPVVEEAPQPVAEAAPEPEKPTETPAEPAPEGGEEPNQFDFSFFNKKARTSSPPSL